MKKGKNNEKVYYLISQLGNGSTLKVWQALDSKGNMVVIKMYVKITGKYGEALTEFFYETSNGCNWEGGETFISPLYVYPFLTKIGNVNKKLKTKHLIKQVMLAWKYCVVMPLFKPVRTYQQRKTFYPQ